MQHVTLPATFLPSRPLDPALWASPVLIGTPETLAALAGQLAVTNLLPANGVCLEVGKSSSSLPEVAGLRVLGTVDDLPHLHRQQPFSCAIVSLPAAEHSVIANLLHTLSTLGIPHRSVTPLIDQLSRPASIHGALRPTINTTELVGRTPHGIDRPLVRAELEAKRVLITGAGGSIGSEIARIAATFNPSMLILMERSENALFEIDRQIARRFPSIERRAILHDVVDAEQTLRHVMALKPHVLFHAAAHKHVPLMEDHPSHALTNNLFGSRSIADAAIACGAERFVMISTDKAVNPSSTMGATKRLAEVYVQWLAEHQSTAKRERTRFSIVRFGNVLGSACSVLPIWSGQLQEGGPLTITDPRMTRYFMTIHEAASLVIQAGAMADAQRTSVYILDMGEPVRILDLAVRLVRQHGLEPRIVGTEMQDPRYQPEPGIPTIDIVVAGVRPGEKLHEELSYQSEALNATAHPGIFSLSEDSRTLTSEVPSMLADLSAVRFSQDAGLIRAAIRRYLPDRTETYQNTNKNTQQNNARTHAA